jgi:hypothetical protein
MRAGDGVSAMLTAAARTRLRTRAEQPLPEPERQPLLADAEWPLQEQRARERVTPDRLVEALAEGLVAVEWEERHEGKVRRSGLFRRVVPKGRDGHGS